MHEVQTLYNIINSKMKLELELDLEQFLQYTAVLTAVKTNGDPGLQKRKKKPGYSTENVVFPFFYSKLEALTVSVKATCHDSLKILSISVFFISCSWITGTQL